jgi:hypothetical protein
MIAELAAIRHVAPQEHQYFGRGIVSSLRRLLASLDPDADTLQKFEQRSRLYEQRMTYREAVRQTTPKD